MDTAEQLRILQAARGSPPLLYLSSVDLAHHALAADERERVKEALLAAAIPHWCDRDVLGALLETTLEESDALLVRLRALTLVEPFPARGEHAVNVHEAARLALREHLRTTDAARWLALSARAHVAQSKEPHARIEMLYHLFAIDQPAAAAECEALDWEFNSGGRFELRDALALALGELTTAGWLTGTAQVEALLAVLEVSSSRGQAAQLETEARQVLILARSASHPSGVGRAQCLLGDVLQAKGLLDHALAAFRECRDIYEQLALDDPSNAASQFGLAAAVSRVGGIYQAQGRLDDALAAFSERLAVSHGLALADPSNAAWQLNLAIAHANVGDIYGAQKRLDDALAAFRKYLAICQRLSLADPSNFVWLRELAVAHAKVGDIYKAQGCLDLAMDAFGQYLAICQRLALADPSNFGWQRELAVAYSRVGSTYEAKGRLDEALAAFSEDLAISERLALDDPSNAGSHYDLAVTYFQLGKATQGKGNPEKAQSSFSSAIETMERAVAMSPGNVGWQRRLAEVKSYAGSDKADPINDVIE